MIPWHVRRISELGCPWWLVERPGELPRYCATEEYAANVCRLLNEDEIKETA